MSKRVVLILTALVLMATAAWMPVAQSEEGNEAALTRQLEDVRQQLHELQLKVQRMEAELDAAQAPSTVPAPEPLATPEAGNPPFPASAVPPGTGATPLPSSAPAPATVVPPAEVPSPPAAARAEAGTSPSPATATAALQWRESLKTQWHSVKAGMSGGEIRELLGAPSREYAIDGKPVWYYTYPGIGNGSVLFSRHGHTVAGWQHPPFGFW